MKARKITAIILMAVMMACSVIFAAPNNTQAATKTGVGMAGVGMESIQRKLEIRLWRSERRTGRLRRTYPFISQ